MRSYLSGRAGCLYRQTAGSWNVLDTLSNFIICNHLSAIRRFRHVPESSMRFHGVLWDPMRFHEVPWDSMRFHEVLWDSMEFHEILWCYCEPKCTHWGQQRSNLLHWDSSLAGILLTQWLQRKTSVENLVSHTSHKTSPLMSTVDMSD
jgi:hypothetical protein